MWHFIKMEGKCTQLIQGKQNTYNHDRTKHGSRENDKHNIKKTVNTNRVRIMLVQNRKEKCSYLQSVSSILPHIILSMPSITVDLAIQCIA